MKIKEGMEQERAEYEAKNSGDPYSRGVIDYELAWAAAMEAQIAQGKTVAEIAKEASRTADTEGITGFMYGCAVQGLAHTWAHGAELLKWHNREYIDDEAKADAATARGGCVNPAIITIGEPA